MALNKLYSPISWENYPSEKTPINEANLNRMDVALNELDNRVIEQDATKANKTSLNGLITDWQMDEKTGIITITKYDGSKIMFDLNIEKIPVSFELSVDGILTMTTEDGTKFAANIGDMIPVLTFEDSDTIAVSVSGTGVNKTYSFSIKNSSVTADMLQPDYLAEVQTAAGQASGAASTATDKSILSKSYAVGGTGSRTGEDTDNAKHYKEQAERISQGLAGALLPMGTITYSQLASQTKQPGYMYNISDSFTTDSTFKDGAGHDYAAGTNVYYTADGYWDCIAGTSVVGVKGEKEADYRHGNVNITPENIGALPEDGNAKTSTKATQDGDGNNIAETYLKKNDDSKDNTVTFSSGDSTSPTGWADINIVTSGETHASLLRKVSLAIKNLRYLYKMLGSTDISAISDGTVTGILSYLKSSLDTTNSNLTQQNYELKELVYASGVAKYNEQDGAVQFVYKNGISRICGLIEVATENPSQLFTAPIAPKKQHWFKITSTSNEKSYTCLLAAVSGVALYWGSEYIPVGIYVIDTTF